MPPKERGGRLAVERDQLQLGMTLQQRADIVSSLSATHNVSVEAASTRACSEHIPERNARCTESGTAQRIVQRIIEPH